MSMMLRNKVLALALCGIVPLLVSGLQAQDGGRGFAQKRANRPPPNGMRVKKLNPALLKVLQDWSQASGQIKKLQGGHTRYVYNKVFNVQKVSTGKFYYEAPDKGRIDIKGVDPKHVKTPRKGFRVDKTPPERWICDGKQIMQIDDEQKTVEIIAIPKQAQGHNIMEGPLPFLLGMPPAKAQRRFRMKLLKDKPTQVILEVEPRWQQDAANWSKATVILDKTQSYLPIAVKMIDPAGTTETVYAFRDLAPNKKANLFTFWSREKNPFDPALRGYKKNFNQVPAANVAARKQGKIVVNKPIGVPALIGLPAERAVIAAKQSGYKVKWKKGNPAKNPKRNFYVYDQMPSAGAELPKGGTIYFTFHDKSDAHPPAAQTTDQSARGQKRTR